MLLYSFLVSVCVEFVSLTPHSDHNFIIFYKQKYVADFYISDFQTGLRALVKAGYGNKVAPFVKPTTVVDVTKENRELSPNFLGWLADRKLSTDDRIMRLKEGYGLHYSVDFCVNLIGTINLRIFCGLHYSLVFCLS